MKRRIVVTLSAVLVSVFAIVGVTYASPDRTWSPNGIVGDSNVTVKKDTTHKGSLYVAGEVIKIEGNVDGSLYCAGQKVTVTGNVTGDIVCAAQQVTISGQVGKDVRVAGQQVNVKNTVGGDATIFAQMADVDSKAVIAGDLNGAVQNLKLDGTVKQNLRFGAQTIALGGTIEGVSDISVQSVDVDGGKFVGNVYYEADKKLDLKQYVEGDVVFNEYVEHDDKSSKAAEFTAFIAFAGISMALFALLIALIAPRFLDRARQFTGQDALNTVLIGLVVVYATPFVLVALALSVVGLPIAGFLTLLWLLILMLSGPFFAYLVGSWILGSSRNILLRMLVGIITVLVLYMIPLINIFAMMTAAVVGSGMVIRGLTRGYRKPDYVSQYDVAPAKPVKVVKKTTKK